MKEKIKVKFVDFWNDPGLIVQTVQRALEPIGEMVISEEPDFVFCSCFGKKDVLHYDCTRILMIGENERPDFNLYDYAFGMDRITYEDRYLYLPYYCWPGTKELVRLALQKHTWSEMEYEKKSGFCSFVCSNAGGNIKRKEIFEVLSAYKRVDSGGKYLNNLADGKVVVDKLEFQKNYRFAIAFENAQTLGYCTEKIFEAFAAGTVPIYWGDPAVQRVYNLKAFINGNDYNSMKELAEAVKEIDQNQKKWLEMLRQPAFQDPEKVKREIEEDFLGNYIRHIVGQGPQKSRRRSNDFWNKNYEENARQINRFRRQCWWRLYAKVERNLVKRGWWKR